jgi:hypothetical protein
MIRKISVDVIKFVGNYLPVHKRKTLRLNFLRTLLSIFDTLRIEYMLWRDEAVIKAYVTGETMSIEWYLNYICGTGTAITIETAGVSGVAAGVLATEPSIYMVAGVLASEPAKYTSVGFPGENTLWGTKTFIVKVPTASSGWSPTITAIVNNYRAAGKSFKIVLY